MVSIEDNSAPQASRYLILGLLTGAYIFSVIDRGIIGVVMTDIQNDFLLNDAQLALLGGTAFSLFYVILGIPIARLADRWNRRYILSVSILVWSAATALSGIAIGFWSLFIYRLLVGVGESGCTPTSHSLIADYFGKKELARALGVYSMGAILGMLAGYVFGSFIAELYGWRVVFIALGIPGVLYAITVFLIVRDPRFDKQIVERKYTVTVTPIWQNIIALLNGKIFRSVMLGHGMSLVSFYALFVWIYPLVERNFEVSKIDIGQSISLALLFGAVPGMVLGGMLTDSLAKLNIQWRGWAPALWVFVSIPFYYATISAENVKFLFLYFGLFAFCINMHHAAPFSIVQLVAKDNERALAVALILLISNLLGYAALPVVAGFLSDTVFSDMGDDSIRWGLGVIGLVSIVGAGMFMVSAHYLKNFKS